MSWLDVAYMTVFFGNFVFMAGAALLLYKVLGATQDAKLHQLEAVSETSVAAKSLQLVAKQLARQLEQRDHELRLLQSVPAAAPVTEPVTNDPRTAEQRAENAELTQRLRDKLKDVLTQNMQLKTELERSKANVAKMDSSGKDIQTGLGEVRGADARDVALVKDLKRMTEGLQLDLAEARKRAQTAEKLAFANAEKLEEMRETMASTSFNESVAASSQASASTTAQLERLREQNDALALREKALLSRIEVMEKEFERHLTEKSFIEDRYVRLDEQAATVN